MAIVGMSRTTGRFLGGSDHVQQSVLDILTTPLGTRVGRRDYGSRLPSLIGSPLTEETRVEIYASVADALGKWEPRLRLVRVQVGSISPGRVEVRISALYAEQDSEMEMEFTL